MCDGCFGSTVSTTSESGVEIPYVPGIRGVTQFLIKPCLWDACWKLGIPSDRAYTGYEVYKEHLISFRTAARVVTAIHRWRNRVLASYYKKWGPGWRKAMCDLDVSVNDTFYSARRSLDTFFIRKRKHCIPSYKKRKHN